MGLRCSLTHYGDGASQPIIEPACFTHEQPALMKILHYRTCEEPETNRASTPKKDGLLDRDISQVHKKFKYNDFETPIQERIYLKEIQI